MASYHIRRLEEADRPWLRAMLADSWGSADIVSRGRVHQADRLPGFLAEMGGEPIGAVTFRLDGASCEVVSLNSLHPGIGIGSALLEAVREEVMARGCPRIWLITTNDNLAALHFYQRRGWRLVAVYAGALALSRRLKPEIPLIGMDGIPLRDEIELELPLDHEAH